MLYLIWAENTPKIKVGFTSKDPLGRLADLQTGSPVKLLLLASVDGEMADESVLHAKLELFRSHGEWFDYGLTNSPSTQPWIEVLKRFMEGEIVEGNWFNFIDWWEEHITQGNKDEHMLRSLRRMCNTIRIASAKTIAINAATR